MEMSLLTMNLEWDSLLGVPSRLNNELTAIENILHLTCEKKYKFLVTTYELSQA
jgi:hypothetical protein